MGPPLQYNPSSFTQAAKDICQAAWDISKVATTLAVHSDALTTPVIKFGLHLALKGCTTELYAVHGETEQVANRVKTAAGVLFSQDWSYGQQLYDGGDYDTRHNGHPWPLWRPGAPGSGGPWLPYGKLPGE